ncbi:putative inositol monophosphatase 3 [Schistocerca gregaria]|uniref:putative inositol monophosphatase 3 n=1 Tax=Schistocerca gregaria TaxID=7010 RepID=UPI00211E3431|nr:putative inositol monophosphatase 3 [Schistocerca gregaria]
MFGGTVRLNPLGVFIIVALSILFFVSLNTNLLRSYDSSKKEPTVSQNNISLRKLLSDCILLAEGGGSKVAEIRKDTDIGETSKGKTKEGAKNVVTKADYNSHCVMYYGLKEEYPTIKVISEEKNKDCAGIPSLDNSKILETVPSSDEYVPATDISVWIDPLDATLEYTENLLQYVTTMICVAVKGKPILGIIHKPFEQEPNTYWGWVGKGTSSNIKYVPDNNLNKIIISRSHTGNTKNITHLAFGNDAKIVEAGGAGYKSLQVATGNFDAYVHTTAINKWDICAGNAVIKALGGQMTTLSNESIDYSWGSQAENTAGLLATVKNHNTFLEKLSRVKKQ